MGSGGEGGPDARGEVGLCFKGPHWAETRSLLLEGSVGGPLKSEHEQHLFLFSESWQASKLI